MKIYISASNMSAANLDKIVNMLESTHHYVHLRTTVEIDSNEKKNLNDIVKKLDNYAESYTQNNKNILNADIVIAEGSMASTGMGIDIATAVANRKPTLILVDSKSAYFKAEAKIPKINNLMSYAIYNDDNLQSIIEEFILASKKLLDSKFILIIPPHIEKYLSWAANKKGIRKAEVVRTAIEQYIENDDIYAKYLSDLIAK